jgi:hypothetical protein
MLRVFRSSMLVWLAARVSYALVLVIGAQVFGLMSSDESTQAALHPVWPSRLLLMVLTAVLVHLDRRLAHEHLLQANFGVPTLWFPATSLVAAAVSDLTIQALLLAI